MDDRVAPQHETTDPNTKSGSAKQGDEPVGLQPAHSELSTTQREGLAALVELGTRSDGALLLTEIGAWHAARGATAERPLLVRTPDELDTANQAARAMLKLDGTLHGPSLRTGTRELAVGELVMIGDSVARLVDIHDRDLPPTAVFGTIERIDRERREIVVDFATAGRHTIALDSPAAAALQYGYGERAPVTPSVGNQRPDAARLLPGRERLTIEMAP